MKRSYIDVCLIQCIDELNGAETSDRSSTSFQELLHNVYQFNQSQMRQRNRCNPETEHSYLSPDFSPTINKLCSFESSLEIIDFEQKFDYFLYLDADIFVASNPFPHIEEILRSTTLEPSDNTTITEGDVDILCGRPWNSYSELRHFPDFVDYLKTTATDDTTIDDSIRNRFYSGDLNYKIMETISPGGTTIFGLCNTGMYFMKAETVQPFLQAIKFVLSRMNDFHPFITSIDENGNSNELVSSMENADSALYRTKHYMVDSIAMWASQFLLNLDVIIAPIEMNYIAAAENYLVRFLHQYTRNSSYPDKVTEEERVWPLQLIHFAKGSDIEFLLQSTSITETESKFPGCTAILTAQLYRPVAEESDLLSDDISSVQQPDYSPLERFFRHDFYSPVDVDLIDLVNALLATNKCNNGTNNVFSTCHAFYLAIESLVNNRNPILS